MYSTNVPYLNYCKFGRGWDRLVNKTTIPNKQAKLKTYFTRKNPKTRTQTNIYKR